MTRFRLIAVDFLLMTLAFLLVNQAKRVAPKLPGVQKVYFAITKGNNRAISRAEVLGSRPARDLRRNLRVGTAVYQGVSGTAGEDPGPVFRQILHQHRL
jgi:hypothetical protein